jgi:hypothetical protein
MNEFVYREDYRSEVTLSHKDFRLKGQLVCQPIGMNDRIDRQLPVADLALQHGEGRKREHWRPDMPRE